MTEKPRWNADAGLSPIEFVRIAFVDEIAAGTLHTGLIHRLDKTLYKKIMYLIAHDKLPSDLSIPKYFDSNTEKLSQSNCSTLSQLFALLRRIGNSETQEAIRLYEIARKRAKKDRERSRP